MAAKTGDVMFTMGGNGTDYNYMLAVDDSGQKRWSVQQLATQPPSLIKDKIDMTIKAAANMRQADDTVIATRTIATLLTELRTITDATSVVTLDGYDGATYSVLLDKRATNPRSTVDQSGRLVEYNIDISAWHMYVAA